MASPKLVVDAIQRGCASVEPRFEGYVKELLTTVVEILSQVKFGKVAGTN